MKKIFVILMFFLVVVLAACRKVPTPTDPSETLPTVEVEMEKVELFDGFYHVYEKENAFEDKIFEFSFLSAYSGDRKFSALGYHIKLYQVLENERVLLSETANELVYHYVKDMQYFIEVFHDSIYKVWVSFEVLNQLSLGDNSITFAANDAQIFSLKTLNDGFYHYNLSNENITISNVCGEFFNSINEKYLYLINKSDSSLTINLNIREPLNVNLDDNFTVDFSNQIVKISNTENERCFIRVVISSDLVGRYACFYDENINVFHSQATLKDDIIEYEILLLPDEEIYIHFSHNDGSIAVNVYEGW